MKKILISLSLFLFFSFINAQNLVPNPSFENIVYCPNTVNEINAIPPWSNPSTGTPDYYNSCFIPPGPLFSFDVPSNFIGYQDAKSGVGYTGIYLSEISTISTPIPYREYLQVPLTSPLIAGSEYNIKFYLSLSNYSSHYVEEIGAYLSSTPINYPQYTNLLFIPQVEQTGVPLNDTTNWITFDQNYTAVGGESYIIIGNFRGLASTTTGPTGFNCSSTSCFAYYYIDDVSVSPTTGIDEYYINNILLLPNPTSGNVSIKLGEVKTEIKITLMNSLGQIILVKEYESTNLIEMTIDAPKGIYFLQLQTEDRTTTKKIIKE